MLSGESLVSGELGGEEARYLKTVRSNEQRKLNVRRGLDLIWAVLLYSAGISQSFLS